MMWLRMGAAVSAASFMTVIDGNKRMDQSSKRLQRCFLTVQISERLVSTGWWTASFAVLASSLTRRACAIAATSYSRPCLAAWQLKTGAHSSGHQPDQPAGRSREPHPLWWPREFEKAGAADADRVA
jgi:hypothetical protein